MLAFLGSHLFSRPAISERHINNEADLILGAPLGLRIYLTNFASTHDETVRWMQDCMSCTLADLMTWLSAKLSLDKYYYSQTGIAFPTTGIVIYLPDSNTRMCVYEKTNTYLTSAVCSAATLSFRDNLIARKPSFPGSEADFERVLTDFILAARFFYLNVDQPVEDAHNFALWIEREKREKLNDESSDKEDGDKEDGDKEDESNDDSSDENDDDSSDESSDDEKSEKATDVPNEWTITKPASVTHRMTTYRTSDLKFALVSKYLPVAVLLRE